MADKTEQEQDAAFREIDDWKFFLDPESDTLYLMNPDTVDKDEYQKAKDGGTDMEIDFVKENYTFTVPKGHLGDKEQWVYRK
ncbi:hypothetical protein BG011_010184 [Mortierella polycephala]|uniref:Uncharacterized protein n=1 Tax=Mortierella polycephala TaxID=41804 RepID=A0A9P6PK08_9FUNG|nr:hypothetical protein BG011_010184 [Mortierella polycephala]